MTLALPSVKAVMAGTASLAAVAVAVVAVQEIGTDPGSHPPAFPSDPGRTGPTLAAAPEPRDEATASDLAAGPDTASAPVAAPAPGATGPVADQAARDKALRDLVGGGETAAALPAPSAAAVGREVRPSISLRSHDSAAVRGLAVSGDEAPDPGWQAQGRDRFPESEPGRIHVTAEDPVSTFSVDVDTASYAVMRKALMQGVLPPGDAVRIEELINYFPYDYEGPESPETPFAADVTVMPTPWNDGTRLMRIGIQGYELAPEERPRANLVFLIDSSGSMNAPDKLPLLRNAFAMLVERLDADDTVAIVAYAGSAGTVLEPTPVSERGRILVALDRLSAGGSTAGGEGIRQAYALAEANFDPDGVNRVILATDGDFNVGIRSTADLQGFVERKRETGVFLSVLGFGRGNYNDRLMQALAQNGNGTAAYIDTLAEARKTLVEEATSTLFPIAKDVKIQVEFNPAAVAEYRLIGYETRLLNREDFNNDAVDAGEIGSGHAVTALYEITAPGSEARRVEALRYGAAEAPEGPADELAFVKIRYKAPEGAESRLITRPVTEADATVAPDEDARFAAAVAGAGQLLRGGRHLGDWGYDEAVALASGAKGADPYGYRAEFVQLLRLADSAAAMERQRP